MRVLFFIDPGMYVIPGGHRVQMEQTRGALEQFGVSVETSDDPDVSLNGFDVVHMWTTQGPMIRRARVSRTPVAISTIYWPLHYTLEGGTQSRRKQLTRRARFMASAARHGESHAAARLLQRAQEQARAFEAADLLLPNGASEERAIRDDLAVTTPAQIVPNAVDPSLFTLPAPGAARSGVLYVGRIEPHKNQLGLIEALRGTGWPVTIIGPTHPHHEAYRDACARAAGPDVTILGRVTDDQLVAAYQQAQVHILPSWFETTGLSSLEAGLCGASIATTSRGFASDYFGARAVYCDPGRPASIREAVEQAAAAGPAVGLREHILENFTWAHTARATLKGYEQVVKPATWSRM